VPPPPPPAARPPADSGNQGPPQTEPPGSVGAGAAAGDVRDRALLGEPEGEPKHLSDYQAPDNPLQIGGQVYLRAQSSALQGQLPDRWSLIAPSLLDVYLDSRPNPRVRAFVLWRTSYDPTAPPAAAPATVAGVTAGNNGAFVGGSATGFTTFNDSRGPNSLLDQMWIRFDIASRVFVTAGKQHVRWGTGRFWQPTDYLHFLRRNPLDVFDARPGTSMLKLHVPWEEKGWNFYAFAITEDPTQTTNALTLRQASGAARAEIVIAGAEIGLDTLVKRDQKPRFGIDVSTGIYDFDIYADAAIRSGEDFQVVKKGLTTPAICEPTDVIPAGTMVNEPHVTTLSGWQTQIVGGVNWSHKYNDNDMYTLGLEYFYNQPGYSDTSLYPGLLFNDTGQPIFNFFYTGRQYGALYATFPAPYSWNYTTFTLSTLANLSDLSFISRLDYSVTILTHLSVEAFVGVHYGSRGGEFRLGFNIPTQYSPLQPLPPAQPGQPPPTVPCVVIPESTRDPAILDLGLALRLKI
jgi:hypothetical protein